MLPQIETGRKAHRATAPGAPCSMVGSVCRVLRTGWSCSMRPSR